MTGCYIKCLLFPETCRAGGPRVWNSLFSVWVTDVTKTPRVQRSCQSSVHCAWRQLSIKYKRKCFSTQNEISSCFPCIWAWLVLKLQIISSLGSLKDSRIQFYYYYYYYNLNRTFFISLFPITWSLTSWRQKITSCIVKKIFFLGISASKTTIDTSLWCHHVIWCHHHYEGIWCHIMCLMMSYSGSDDGSEN